MATNKLLKNLAGYNEAKQKAEENPGGNFPVIPNGNYDARIVGAEARLSKNKEAMLMINLVIVGDSEEADNKIASFIMLEGLGSGLERLIRLGYELPEESSGIQHIIDDLSSSEKEVSITVKNGFATINGPLDDVYVSGEDADEADEESDEEETEEVEEEEVEEETEESEGDEVLHIGDDVSFQWNKDTLQGSIIAIDEKTDLAKVKCNGKLYSVKLEKIIGKIEEEEEVEEEPVKKPAPKKGAAVAKKVASKKPVKKVTKKK